MKLHALVIDDSADILEDVADRLESLGHTCDRVSCQNDAREHLEQNSYSYVLLDMEIPSQYGKPSRKTNGKNLLCEIRQMDELKDLPVIVMTSHGLDGPDLAIEVFRDGQATDLVKKPFPSMGENTLEKRIVLALEKAGRTRPGAATRNGPAIQAEPQQFEEGEMVFTRTRVELCGVKIAGAVDQTRRRKILDALKGKRDDGRFVAFSGDELAGIVGCEYRGQNGVSETVSQFRSETVAAFLTEVNVTCGSRDIIQSGGRGYRFTEKITIRESNDPQNGPQSGPHEPQNDPENDPLNERQKWVLEQLASGVELKTKDVLAHFKCGQTTAKRDLAALRTEGRIAFEGAARTGHWRLT